ncbi:MAG: peptidylprolyl isomerase [Planktomarina sp.]
MAEKKRSTASSAAIWIIVGLLMFAMIGFGAAGLSGTARSIGTVGDKPLSVQSYYTALNNQTRQTEQQIGRALTQQEVQGLGLDRQALAGLIAQRSLDQVATDLGLSVGDAEVRRQILAIPAFTGLTGSFDRAAYAQLLDQNGLSEAEFETSLRESATRDILAQAVIGDVAAPDAYANTLLKFIGETRNFAWVQVSDSDISTGTPVPTAEDLTTFHAENEILFTSVAAKRIEYIWASPDQILDTMDVSDAEIAALYQERSDQFNTPETRIVERLIFPDQDAAQAAIDAIAADTSTFEAAVEARGLTMADVDLGDVIETDLGDLGAAVFAPAEPGVVGPLPTDLGPAIYRISVILDAQTVTLATATADLRDELAREKAESELQAQGEDINDLLAGGATLQELATETAMQFGTLDWHRGVDSALNDYSEFQTAAADVTVDDFPELLSLSDGGYFAIEFIEDVPAALQPFDTVKAEVEAAWARDAQQTALTTYADGLVDQLGDAQLSSLGLITVQEADMSRTDIIDDVTPALISSAFEVELGETRTVQDAGSVLIIQLNAIHPAETDTDEATTLRDLLTSSLSDQLSQSIFDSFAQGVQQTLDVDINQQTLASITSQVRGGHSQ